MQIRQCKISEVKSNDNEFIWKDLMRECLMKTEIFEKENVTERSLSLDPNCVMDLRHKMVKESTKIFQIPQTQIHCDALKLLRERNYKRMQKQKEEKLVEKEIGRLKKTLENNRFAVQKKLEESTRTKCCGNSTKFSKFWTKQWKRSEFCDDMCTMDAWFNGPFQVETKHDEEEIAFDVRLTLRSRREEVLEPAPTLEESFSGDEHLNQVSEAEGKNVILEKFFHQKAKSENRKEKRELKKRMEVKRISEVQNKINLRRVQHAWLIWKVYTEEVKKRKREKTNYKRKIDAFLTKLQNTKIEEKRIKMNNIQNIRTRDRTIKMSKKQKREENLKEIMREVKTSQAEACRRLKEMRKAILKNQEESENLTFLKKMEERREERLKRRLEIKERRKKLEEEKKKAERQKEDEKKKKEEENKRKKLEESKEKRRLEKEKKEEKEREREKQRANKKLAENQYRKHLLRGFGLRPWIALIKMQRSQQEKALAFSERKLLQNVFLHLRAKAREKAELKIRKAEEFHERILKKKFLQMWLEFHKEQMKQNQVAVDWNDFRITERAFKRWIEFTQDEQLDYLNKKDVAEVHYERTLKRKYFKKLVDYPEVKKIEQEIEKRKRKWRQKIKEILPDYEPPDISDAEKRTEIRVQ